MSCPDCFRGFTHDYAEPTGTELLLHGVRTYSAGHPGQRSSPSTIIFFTDVFGLSLVNNKLLADYFASQTGCTVLVPDLVPGGGLQPSCFEIMDCFVTPVRWWDIYGQLMRLFSAIRMLGFFLPIALGTKAAYPRVLAYTRAVKANLPAGGKLGVAGYCWGGLQSTKLSQEPATEGGDARLIDAHYTAHPSSLKLPYDLVQSVEKFKVPLSLASGDGDFAVTPKRMLELEVAMRQKFGDGNGEYAYELKMYQDCKHGFAIRANLKRKQEDAAAEEAAIQAIKWFKRFL
ncbi:dienelactone hydrolase [Nemania abortiva]|nr:dienelactone hydrolase [Nemania abortiva]